MPQPVTMSEVARAAGVSSTTVSYVLSGKRAVAPRTRQAVEKAVAELGFTLNTVARNLRTGRSTLIALIVPDLANPFYAQLADGLQETLRGPGYHLVVGNSHAQGEEERAYLAEAVQQRLAGVVITPFRITSDDLAGVAEADIPVVVSADNPFGDVDQVLPESADAVRDALERVTAAGRSRIGMIAGPEDVTGGDPRLEVLRAQGAHLDITVSDRHVMHAEHTKSAGADAFEELMRQPSPPDAVFCVNDVTAVGALERAEQMGVAVPDDVALIGHDDIEFASLVRPRLSTVRYPAREAGRACGRLLLQRLEGSTVPQSIHIPTRFIRRGSA